MTLRGRAQSPHHVIRRTVCIAECLFAPLPLNYPTNTTTNTHALRPAPLLLERLQVDVRHVVLPYVSEVQPAAVLRDGRHVGHLCAVRVHQPLQGLPVGGDLEGGTPAEGWEREGGGSGQVGITSCYVLYVSLRVGLPGGAPAEGWA